MIQTGFSPRKAHLAGSGWGTEIVGTALEVTQTPRAGSLFAFAAAPGSNCLKVEALIVDNWVTL